MINPSASQFPLQPISWSDIARLCRRVCLLRECGQPVEAEQVRQGALAEALTAMRSSGASETIVAQQLETIFAAEAERVANAAVLAELLRPMLAPSVAVPVPSVSTALASAESAAPVATAAPFTPPAPAAITPKREAPRAAPADIASFIDDMLAQERAAPAPEMRRVS